MKRDQLREGAYYVGRSIFTRKITTYDRERNLIKWCDTVGPGECKIATFLNWASGQTRPDQATKDKIEAAIAHKRNFEANLYLESQKIIEEWKAEQNAKV